MDPIALQILVREGYRTGDAMARVAQQLRDIGLDVTASGRATLSARASADTFARLFGRGAPTAPLANEAEGRAAADDMALRLPPALHEAIESITIAPKPIYMHRPDREGGSP